MENPFQFIECKLTHREEFDMTEGYQPTYALFYLKEGSFRLEMNGESAILRQGDCAIFTDDVNFSRCVLEPISFVYLKFRVNPRCSFSLPLPTGKVTFRNENRFLENIRTYEALMDATDARSLYRKEHLLEDILLLLVEEEEHPCDTDCLSLCHDDLVRRGVAYIREHLAERLSVSDLCRVLGTNASTLNFRFRRALSVSVGEQIIRERMRHGRKLLAGTTFSVGEVASRCGYENIYYFSTAFRKQTGLSPTAYRAIYR